MAACRPSAAASRDAERLRELVAEIDEQVRLLRELVELRVHEFTGGQPARLNELAAVAVSPSMTNALGSHRDFICASIARVQRRIVETCGRSDAARQRGEVA